MEIKKIKKLHLISESRGTCTLCGMTFVDRCGSNTHNAITGRDRYSIHLDRVNRNGTLLVRCIDDSNYLFYKANTDEGN